LKLELADFQIVWVGQIHDLIKLVFGEHPDYQCVNGSVFTNHLIVNKLFEGFPNSKTVIEVLCHYLLGLGSSFLVNFISHL
jgi:hypothetical protein